ncbi:unnamed protein product [Symbiodinium microadriaticum]|nr:unnamed protein product [Symbiodinium microadriaticum]
MAVVLVSTCNPGSTGHPELCARPCVYIAKGGACNESCQFCHMAHEQAHLKLDQRARRLLRSLDAGQKLQLLLEVVQQRAQQQSISPSLTVQVVHVLEQAIAEQTTRGELSSQRGDLRQLRRALQKMTLSSAVRYFVTWLPAAVVEALGDLRAGEPGMQSPSLSPLAGSHSPSRGQVSTLKDALLLFPAPQVAVKSTWFL